MDTAPRRSLTARPSISSLGRVPWDLLVIGGGITGAGVFREAACRGLRALLVEQGDFASGTSSRSSKLVHGGLQYLARFQIGLARESVRERERLVRERPGLVYPLRFVLATFPGGGVRGPPWLYRSVVAAYRALSPGTSGRVPTSCLEPPHCPVAPAAFPLVAYQEAGTDDARLVLRLIAEGVEAGGTALNYVRVADLIRNGEGEVLGADLRCRLTGARTASRPRVVVNASGPWIDRVKGSPPARKRVRLVRGSHLVLPRHRLPLPHAVAALRPGSGHPVVFVPWQGVVLVGGTAEDHGTDPDLEPTISPDEVLTLLADVRRVFPEAGIGIEEVQATFSGVRPVTDLRSPDPGRASREAAIWVDGALVTVAGGKLTTFRATALRVLERCRPRLPGFRIPTGPDADPAPGSRPRDREWRMDAAGLRRAAECEGVHHLDDLLSRRFRVGLTLPEGGLEHLPWIRRAVGEALGWDDVRWRCEVETYRDRRDTLFGLPSLLRATSPPGSGRDIFRSRNRRRRRGGVTGRQGADLPSNAP